MEDPPTNADASPRPAMDGILLRSPSAWEPDMPPKLPGTVGSLLGLPGGAWDSGDRSSSNGFGVAGVLLFLIGIPICETGIRSLHAKDPSQVVFDEIAAFAWVFLLVPVTPATMLLGFLLFRLFDITKPWPIRSVERLPGAWGVMLDDYCRGAVRRGSVVGLVDSGIHIARLWQCSVNAETGVGKANNGRATQRL